MFIDLTNIGNNRVNVGLNVMQRMAGNRLTGQLNDPNLPCMGESLLPTTEHAGFDADPVERARQLVIAKGG